MLVECGGLSPRRHARCVAGGYGSKRYHKRWLRSFLLKSCRYDQLAFAIGSVGIAVGFCLAFIHTRNFCRLFARPVTVVLSDQRGGRLGRALECLD
ncbi:hypothetical protein D3C84_911680 [compost metagenome]